MTFYKALQLSKLFLWQECAAVGFPNEDRCLPDVASIIFFNSYQLACYCLVYFFKGIAFDTINSDSFIIQCDNLFITYYRIHQPFKCHLYGVAKHNQTIVGFC